jgi:hypothetical protein
MSSATWGAAVPELGAGAARLDDGHAEAERRDLLGDRLAEPLDAPFGRVVHRAAGEGDLAVVGRDLDDTGRPPILHPGAAHAEGDANVVVTDAAPVYPGVLDEMVPAAWHLMALGAGPRSS